MKARRNYLYLAFIPNKCQVWLHDKRTVLDQPIGKRLGGSVDHLACRSQEVGKNHPGPNTFTFRVEVNDDTRDNRFYEKIGRYPAIEEDAQPLRLLIPDLINFLK